MKNLSALALSLALLALSACKPAATQPPAATAKSTSAPAANIALTPATIGAPLAPDEHPWIAHITTFDLDNDGLLDVLACDAKQGRILWLRQFPRGTFTETVLADKLPAPVHIDAADMRGTGHPDLLIACMGQVFPNNDKIGSIIILENDGQNHFTPRVVAERLMRVTDVRAADLNGDGRPDLAVAQFGYDQGEVRWMENLGNNQWREHNLLNLPGAINILAADFTGNRRTDLAVLISQDSEEVYLFQNDGRGNFTNTVLFGSTNKDFGSSGITLADLNRDGRPDILNSNGDGFDHAEAGARPWHGVQWLENLGGGAFRFHRIGDMAGAFSPAAIDLDGDGNMDVAAVSCFNDWKNPQAVSLMWFQNDGKMNFSPHILAHAPTHQVCCIAADLDGNGKPVLVTSGFHAYPPFDRLGRITLWRVK